MPDDVAETITLFQVNGVMRYCDPRGAVTGHEDVFTWIAMYRRHLAEAGRRAVLVDSFSC